MERPGGRRGLTVGRRYAPDVRRVAIFTSDRHGGRLRGGAQMSLEIVCEWIERTGGAERVLEAMIEAFPQAPVHTLWNDAPDRTVGVDVRESWLSRTPLRHSKALALPFFDPTWRSVRAVGVPDTLLVSSYVFAHHIRMPKAPTARKYVYVHSPARYIWAPDIDPRGRNPFIRLSAPYWKRLDRRRASEGSSFASNSQFVRERVERSWGVESTVIHPPVDTEKILGTDDWRDRLSAEDEGRLRRLPDEFVLGASRLVAYKGLDSVIDFAKSVGLPVVIVGVGPHGSRLKEYAASSGVRAVFLGEVSDALLLALYQRTVAFVFPPIEDFGIMPVEAMAAGGRVIVADHGGVIETVEHGVSGVQASGFSGSEAREALDLAARLDPVNAKERAGRFSQARFIDALTSWIGA